MRSLCNKFNELKPFVLENDFTAVAITETWLQPKLPDDLYRIPGYKLIRQDRPTLAGGVAFYIVDSCKYAVLDKNVSESVEYLIIKLCIKNFSLGLAVVYRPDDSSLGSLNIISDVVMCFHSHDIQQFVILGDFNVNLLSNRPSSKFFNELLSQHSCLQLVKDPTRVTESSESLLDPVITNLNLDNVSANVLDFCFSDHNVVTCTVDVECGKPAVSYKVVRSFRNFDFEQFLHDASAIHWDCIYYLNSLDEKVAFLTGNLLKLFDAHAPLKVIRVRHNKRCSPWFTHTLKILRRRVRESWRRYVRSKHPPHRRYYTSLRNFYNSALIREKRSYFSTKIREYRGNTRQLWQNFRQWNVIPSGNNVILPDHLLDPNLLNDHFISSVSSLCPPPSDVSDDFSLLTFPESKFEFHLPSTEEIRSYILKIKPDITGPDGLSGRMLQLAVSFIVEPLTHVINSSFECGIVPQQWKYCSTFPVIKKSGLGKDDVSLNDLRPISILPVCLKIAEHFLHNQLTDYIEKHNILPAMQSGFRANYSTTSALCSTLDDIISAADNGLVTHLTLLDMSKAFDTVSLPRLIRKLQIYGVQGHIYQWISSYLTGRVQLTSINTPRGVLHSNCLPVVSGVPQGSILGPLLFTLYVADLPKTLQHCSVQLFADDILLYHSFPPQEEQTAATRVTSDLNSIYNWLNINNLVLNPDKCECILVGSRHARGLINNFDVSIAGVRVARANAVRTLGLLVDEGLTFATNISKLCQKAYFSLKQLLPFKLLLDSGTKLLLCESLVLSHFNYCDIVYGPCITQADNQRLQKIQNFCIRFITFVPRFTHVTPYIRNLRCLKIQERRLVHYVSFLNKIVHSGRPSYLFDKMTKRSSLHNLPLRHVDSTLAVPKHSTSLYRCSFSYLSAYLCNNLLSRLPDRSPVLLKNTVKDLLLSGSLDGIDLSLF